MGIRVLVLKYDTCSLRSTKFGTIGHVQCVCALFFHVPYNLQPIINVNFVNGRSIFHNKDNTVLGYRSTSGPLAIVHFGSVGRLCGLFERSKAT